MAKLKEKIRQGRAACKYFWIARRSWILPSAVLAIVVVLVVLAWTGVIETGFGEYAPNPNSKLGPERAKTLWDWLDLLLVPLLLLFGAWWLDRAVRTREYKAEERRNKEQQSIELDRSRETALRAYLDSMTELIRDGLRESEPDDAKRSIARARTLAALRQLDGRRNDLLLRFLRESGLMAKEGVVTLSGADLSGARLRGASLSGANLVKTDLSGADLNQARLSGANLMEADLVEASLGSADLEGANLTGADLADARLWWAKLRGAHLMKADLFNADLMDAGLSGADLSRARLLAAKLRRADLTGAKLCRADLMGAYLGGAELENACLTGADLRGANLEWANLQGATVTNEQLAQAESLEGATLPDGTEYTGELPAEAEQSEANELETAPAIPEPQDADGDEDAP